MNTVACPWHQWPMDDCHFCAIASRSTSPATLPRSPAMADEPVVITRALDPHTRHLFEPQDVAGAGDPPGSPPFIAPLWRAVASVLAEAEALYDLADVEGRNPRLLYKAKGMEQAGRTFKEALEAMVPVAGLSCPRTEEPSNDQA